MNKAITVSHLSKVYSKQEAQLYFTLRDSLAGIFGKKKSASKDQTFFALKNLNFSIKPGEVVGIIGKNGAGKSTLLKVLSRITPPTSGKAVIDGRVSSMLEVGTGFHQELTGRENIFLNGSILGMSRKEITSKIDQIIDFAEIQEFIDMPVKHYSSGMFVRLAFSVAAHLEPEILIVDEVLSVGDSAFQRKSLTRMNQVSRQKGKTIIFVSHNMDAIKNLCTRCLLLEDGKIAKDGPTNEVVQHYLTQSQTNSYSAPNDLKKAIKIANITIDTAGNDLQVTSRYYLNREKRGLKLGCIISTAEGSYLYSSLNPQLTPKLVSPQGEYISSVSFDFSQMKSGIYQARVFASLYGHLASLESVGPLTFYFNTKKRLDPVDAASRSILIDRSTWKHNQTK